jgi:hypothetical protein
MQRRQKLSRLIGEVLAVGLLAVGAAACGDDDDDDDSGFTADAGDSVQAPAAGGEAQEQPGASPPLSSILDRKIIFTAGIVLSVEDVGASFGDVSRLATAAGGFIESSSLANADDIEERSARVTLRVPADRYQDTLASLRGLAGASVKTENSKSSEVTEEYTDLQSRQRNLERTEQQYLALLARATTIPEILTVQDRLDAVRGQIEQIQGRLAALDDLVDLATIDVTLLALPPAQVSGDGGPKGVTDSFVDAWAWFLEASRYVASAAAVLAVAAIFLAVPGGVVLAVALLLRRLRPRALPS